MPKDAAKKKVKALENQVFKLKEKLAKARGKVKPEPVEDYEFQGAGGKAVRLSQLFGGKKELILIHNMGSHCPYCTLWADGFNGFLPHLENRAAFVVESPDKPATQAKFARARGWNFRMVSSGGTPFRKDMGYTFGDGMMRPGVSVFVKKAGKIVRVSDTQFGPGDNYCALWDLFDLLPGGPGNWSARFKY